MKNKKGFTLAEVLITLTIIGVVAVLVTPALNSAVQKSKVGPTIRKFISTMENANEHIMGDNEVDALSGVVALGRSETVYYEKLKNYVKGTYSASKTLSTATPSLVPYTSSATIGSLVSGDNVKYSMNDESEFVLAIAKPASSDDDESLDPAGSYKGIWGNIYFDINGFNNKPNKMGKDVFAIVVDDNGSLLPRGGMSYSNAYNLESQLWQTGTDVCSSASVGSGLNCTGSIADNGWKVIYKY